MFATHRHKWTQQDDALIGVIPDTEVAIRLGMTQEAVKLRRRHLNRKPVARRSGVIDRKKLAELRVNSDRPWTKSEVRLLGTAIDAEVALRVGRPAWAVKRERQRREIKPFKTANRSWNRSEVALLGKYSDADVARRLRRTELAVQMQRQDLGIPKFNARRRVWTKKDDRIP